MLGSKWGIFVLDSAKVPESNFWRSVKSLVGRNLSAEVQIPKEALKHFKTPPVIGPFSAFRRWAGVKSSPLGSIDMTTGEFLPGVIRKGGQFVEADFWDRLVYYGHQGLLDYGYDGLIYTSGGIVSGVWQYVYWANLQNK